MSTTAFRLSQVSVAQRRTLIAAALGWMLDAFDVMLYALVLTHIMGDLGMSKGTAGLLNTLTLLASGIGGVLFGFLADRVGRKRALMLSILTYSLCSFASGLSTSVAMLAFFRFVLGLGMGGEWNTGATLVAETWPDHLRARALAIVQSSWAIGFAAAALVSGSMLRYFSWRAVFFVGILPALVTLWIRKDVPESEMWSRRKSENPGTRPATDRARHVQSASGFSELFSPRYLKQTFALLLLNFFGLFAYWGLFSWVPAYLSLPVSQGGRGFGLMDTTTLLLVLNLAGMLPGYLCYGWFADRIGRRGAFLLYLFVAAALVPIYAAAREQWLVLVTGALVGFFGTGFFSGSGLIGSEIFPTRIRARALGFTYNGARTLSALAPFVIGRIGQSRGLDWAFYVCAASFLLAGLMATQLPETRGKSLA
ncbi:MAG TPA: MFS transporter [Terriglobales bacterium]|nr:MFS transporter [Terriglobales bacterium]